MYQHKQNMVHELKGIKRHWHKLLLNYARPATRSECNRNKGTKGHKCIQVFADLREKKGGGGGKVDLANGCMLVFRVSDFAEDKTRVSVQQASIWKTRDICLPQFSLWLILPSTSEMSQSLTNVFSYIRRLRYGRDSQPRLRSITSRRHRARDAESLVHTEPQAYAEQDILPTQ